MRSHNGGVPPSSSDLLSWYVEVQTAFTILKPEADKAFSFPLAEAYVLSSVRTPCVWLYQSSTLACTHALGKFCHSEVANGIS